MLNEPRALEDLPEVDPFSRAFAAEFSEFLRREDYVDEFAIRRAIRAHEQTGGRFDSVLTNLGIVGETRLVEFVSAYLDIPVVKWDSLSGTAIFKHKLDPQFLISRALFPIADDGQRVTFATPDPFNLAGISELSFALDRRARIVLGSRSEILRKIHEAYAVERGLEPTDGNEAHVGSETEDVRRLKDMASDAPIIRYVNDIIDRAAKQQASDIHLEPREDSLAVRFRIDGSLREIELLPPASSPAIVSRIKILARMDISERRLPQDGRAVAVVDGRPIDLRISSLPTLDGESIVMRLLDKSTIRHDFDSLGLGGKHQAALRRLVSEPNGIVLVTGPTGSGKTTTLYSALQIMQRPDLKIFTVEDPVEYKIKGLSQIQVQPKIGLTFAHTLRSVLRQDPDVIMVGEIRDLETARVAVQASLTGHLVLSTLHTSGAASTLSRLLDMGIERYLLASSLRGILSQRLVRRICPECSKPGPPSETLRQILADRRQPCTDADLAAVRTPSVKGCPACHHSGFAGRTTIAELIEIKGCVRQALLKDGSEAELEAAAIADGEPTMFDDGIAKVLIGVTTLEEVLRVTRVV